MKKFWSLLEKRSLVSKLLVGFGALLLIILLLSINSIFTVRAMSQQASELYQRELLGISHIKETNINLILIGRSLRQYILAPSPAQRNDAKVRFDQAILTLEKELNAARNSIYREREIRLLDEYELEFSQYKHNANYAITLVDENAEYQGKATFRVTS